MYCYGIRENLLVKFELISSEKVVLQSGDNAATYKLSDCSLEYGVLFEEPHPTEIGELYAGTTSILYNKVTSIHYQTLSEKETEWKINVNNLSVHSLQGLLLLFLDKRSAYANKHKEMLQAYHQKSFSSNRWHASSAFCCWRTSQRILPRAEKVLLQRAF